MADFRPLQAIRYDVARIGDLRAVVAPPYDVISRDAVARLYARSPFNIIRLILNREEDSHAAAAGELRSWLAQGVLTEDRTPAFFFYSQTFELVSHERRRRDGIIGVMRLEQFGSGRVCPHEQTHAAPKADRLGLIRACKANLSPIFGIVSCPGVEFRDVVAPAVARVPAVDLFDDAGVQHQLWPITDPALASLVSSVVKDEPVVIADGHHRYETALDFRDEMRRAHPGAGPDAPFESVLMYLSNIDEPGLVVLPTHRILPAARPEGVRDTIMALGDLFDVTTHGSSEWASFIDEVERGDGRRIGCVLPDALMLLTLRVDATSQLPGRSAATRRLTVVLLHDLVLARLPDGALTGIEYTHDDALVLAAVNAGGGGAAFLVNAPTAQEVREVCLAGEKMPQKSTYFYPKLLSGLVLRSLAV